MWRQPKWQRGALDFAKYERSNRARSSGTAHCRASERAVKKVKPCLTSYSIGTSLAVSAGIQLVGTVLGHLRLRATRPNGCSAKFQAVQTLSLTRSLSAMPHRSASYVINTCRMPKVAKF